MKHLVDAAKTRDCDLHAYVLMTNHVHLLATGQSHGAISQWMQDTGRAYVRFLNGRRGRTGGLFEGRFRGSLVESGRYFLACMRYIELNPVRAGMVERPSDYRWSSHCANASGAPPPPLTAHDEYLNLGRTIDARAHAYRALFDVHVEDRELEAIRESLAMNRVLGCERFVEALGGRLDRNVGVVPQGRPKKGTEPKVL
jgi:putative transposase